MTKTYNCLIVDDEEMAIKVISSHLEQVPDFNVVGEFSNPVEAFQVLDTQEIDVLFLDIQMPEITGVSMLQMMKKPPLTVFTTAYREFALDGYELDVVDYLMKPIGFQRFLQAISKIRERSKVEPEPLSNTSLNMAESPDHLFIRSERSYQKVKFDEILHIEAIRNHIKVVTTDLTHISMIPISEVEEKLPEYFVRIHRSFLVNAHQIKKFNNQEVGTSKAELPVGRSYRDTALSKIRSLLLGESDI